MKKIIVILLLLIPSVCHAQWGFFPDNILFRNDGTDLEGTGKILDLRSNVSVTYDSTTSTYHLAATGGGGELTDLSDVNSSTQTAGNILVSNGIAFNSVVASEIVEDDVYDEATWQANLNPASKNSIRDKIETIGGTSKFTDSGAVTYLTEQGDHMAVGGVTSDSAAFFVDVSNKTAFAEEGFKLGTGVTKDSVIFVVNLFGSDTAAATYDSANDEIDINKPLNIAGNVQSKSSLGLIVNDGQDATVEGDFTYKSGSEDKLIRCSAADNLCRIGDYDTNYMEITNEGVMRFIGAGSVSMDSLTEVNSSTQVSGNLLISNGVAFNSIAMSGDCTLTGDGTATCSGGSGATKLTELSDVNSATQTSGNILITNGVNFNSIAMSGDCTITGSGAIDCPNVAASNLTDLTDVNTATATSGRLLIGTGTGFDTIDFVQVDIPVRQTKLAGVDDNGTVTASIFGFSELVVDYTGVTAVDVDANWIVLRDSNDVVFIAKTVNETCTITTGGINGLEGSDSEATSKWYEIYIYAKEDGTVDCLMNEAGGTVGTTPAGYVYSALVGYTYNDSGDDLREFTQNNNYVMSIVGTTLTSTCVNTPTNLDCSVCAPPKAREVLGRVLLSDSDSDNSCRLGPRDTGVAGQLFVAEVHDAGDDHRAFYSIQVDSSQVFEHQQDATVGCGLAITCQGYILAL